MHIETERLFLREILPTDECGLFELESDPRVHTYLGENPVIGIGQVRDIIKMIRRQYAELGIGRLAIIDKSTNAFIGWAGLKLVKEKTNNQINFYDLGYRIIQKHWGKGIATEASHATLTYGFNKLNLAEIYGMCEVGNQGSKNVLQKSGLRFIETFEYKGRQHNWFRLTKNEWEHENTAHQYSTEGQGYA